MNASTPGPLQPQHGDIMLTRPSHSVVRYTVGEASGTVLFSGPSREDAIRLARLLAQEQGVDLWYCDDRTCLLLECYGRHLRSDRSDDGSSAQGGAVSPQPAPVFEGRLSS
jgi:hypothetical protein